MSFVDSLYELARERIALSDHRESEAWLISNGPHSVAECYKLGPNRIKAECLCPPKAATIFQHTHATRDYAWPRPPTTKDMKTLVTPAQIQGGFLPTSLARFHTVGTARNAHAVHTQCNNIPSEKAGAMKPFQFQVCHYENTFPVMFGIPLVQSTHLPGNMMEWMRLAFVHSAPRSTPPHFVVNVIRSIVLSVLTHTIVETMMQSKSVCFSRSWLSGHPERA